MAIRLVSEIEKKPDSKSSTITAVRWVQSGNSFKAGRDGRGYSDRSRDPCRRGSSSADDSPRELV